MTKIKWFLLLACFLIVSQTQGACGLHCLQCPTLGTCSSCQTGFFVVNRTFCAPCPIGCSSCNLGLNGMPVCQRCVAPAQLGGNGTCFICDPGCLTCQSIPINCTSCKDGFNLTVANFFGTCQSLMITCPIVNCNSCSTGPSMIPVCDQCISGYFNARGQCYPCRFPCVDCSLDFGTQWTNISQFWTDFMSVIFNMSGLSPGMNMSGMNMPGMNMSGMNMSGLPPMPPVIGLNFSNMTEQEMYSWAQGYYTIRTLQSFLPPTMTFGDLLAEAMAFYPTIQNLDPTRQQLAVLTKFNSLIGKNLTLEIIMTRQLQIIQNTTTCAQCVAGFQLDLVGNCTLCPLNCAVCSAGACTTCKLGFYQTGGSCQPCDASCGACLGSATNCTLCLPPQFLASGTCVTCADQCSSCNSANTNTCLTCKLPFSLVPDGAGQCFRCLQDACLQCDSTNTSICLVCRNGSSLVNGRCQQCPLNCISCLLSIPPLPATCFQCSNGFTISNETCIPCSPGCLSCSNGTVCTQCQVGLFLNGTGSCQKCREGCLQCTSLLLCNNFEDGIIMKDNIVIKCRQGCKVCSQDRPDICTACEPRYFLSSDVCNSCQSGCQVCSSASTCTKCIGNLILSAGDCLRCQGNCRTCDSTNQSICLTCIRGTVLNGTQCVAVCPIGCLDCDPTNTTTCFKCDQGHALTPTARCIKCLGSCSGSCDARNISLCLGCVDGFELKSNQCVRCPEGCATCLNNHCLSCAPGYKLTQNSAGDFSCLFKCRSPCATCSGDFCSECEAGYTYHNGMCHADLSCNPRCDFCPRGTEKTINGSCVSCPTNCSTCLSGQCVQCNEGMFLNSNNQCVACPPQCRTCFNNDSCQRCSAGYVKQILEMTNGISDAVDNDKCIACDSNCRTCIVQPDRCTSCFQGFRLMSYRCAGLFNVIYRYELNLNYSNFLDSSSSQGFVEALSSITGVDIRDNYIQYVLEGSVVVGGSISAQNQQNAQNIQQSLGSSVGNYPVLSSSSEVYYADSPIVKSQQEAAKSVNIGLIIGAVIGGIAVIVIVGVTIYMIRRRKFSQTEVQNTEETLGDVDNKQVNNTFGTSQHDMPTAPNKQFIVEA